MNQSFKINHEAHHHHFFDSKAELAIEALDSSWQVKRVELDQIFSVTVPPLERLQKYCEFSFNIQKDMNLKYGRVLGCPQFALGCEVCTQEDALQKKIQSILDYKRRYIESAVRDATAAGEIQASDPAAKARMIVAYYEGLLTQARIQNDVNILREMWPGVMSLLGAKAETQTV